MVMKKDGRKRDIKSKLVAAVCMLLVSCIMMVSSTYAWFTLSTAPEVTGITTAVGANGNLEMALIPGMKDETNAYATIGEALAAIGNASTSMSTNEANTTWGNLVDLTNGYGLDKITLYPSKMEPTADGNLPTYYLGTPKYGADGRYNDLNYTASAAIYNANKFGTTGFGVRAVGTSSGMSAQELAYRSALAAANNAADSALAAAKSAVSTGGSKLASLAVNKATGTTAFDAAEKVALLDAYAAIENAVNHIETALKSYIIADFLSSSAVNETTYAEKQAEMEGKTLAELKTYTGVNATLAGYIDTLSSLKSTVTTNKDGLNALQPGEDGKYSWTSMSVYVTPLANIEAMLLNGHNMDYWMEKGADNNFTHLAELAGYVLSGTPLTMTVNAGGSGDNGIFAKLADFVDTFSTPATISGVKYQGISADNLKVTMTVTKNATVTTAYLTSSKTEATTYDSTVFVTGGATNLSDFYGYILDMAFRTNAADSYLQLQTEGVDRIYADSQSNPTTMGGGSFISYTIPANSDYSTEKLVNLMGYIRVVFFDPANANKILGYARLDPATQQITGDDATGYTVKMQLKMRTLDDSAWAANQQIVQLIQNEAKAVSTMVYLDGETLTNADVANTNLVGKMNIQFSSSAKLNPMEYGDLRNPNNNAATDKFGVKVNGVAIPDVEVTKGASYSLNISSYLEGKTPTSVEVSVGGQVVPDAYNAGTTTISLTNVQGEVEVTIVLPT